MAQRLSDLHGREVSLVGRAANRRRFLLTKADEGEKPMPKLDEVKALQTIEKIDAEGNGDLIEALAGSDPEGVSELLAKADLSEDEKRRARIAMRVMGADVAKKYLAALTKVEEPGAKCPHCDAANKAGAVMCAECGKPMMAKNKGVTKMDLTTIEKRSDGSYNLDGVPEEQRPAIEAVLKSADAREAQLRAELEKSSKEAEKAQNQLAEIQAESERKDAIAKAAEFRDLPGVNPDDFGPVLQKIRKAVEPAEYDGLLKVLRASQAIVRKSALFGEIGEDAGGSQSARAELNRKAEDLRKGDPKLSIEQARARVIKSDTALMQRVNQEDAERRQRARE